jgi:hypothetical protein
MYYADSRVAQGWLPNGKQTGDVRSSLGTVQKPYQERSRIEVRCRDVVENYFEKET